MKFSTLTALISLGFVGISYASKPNANANACATPASATITLTEAKISAEPVLSISSQRLSNPGLLVRMHRSAFTTYRKKKAHSATSSSASPADLSAVLPSVTLAQEEATAKADEKIALEFPVCRITAPSRSSELTSALTRLTTKPTAIQPQPLVDPGTEIHECSGIKITRVEDFDRACVHCKIDVDAMIDFLKKNPDQINNPLFIEKAINGLSMSWPLVQYLLDHKLEKNVTKMTLLRMDNHIRKGVQICSGCRMVTPDWGKVDESTRSDLRNKIMALVPNEKPK